MKKRLENIDQQEAQEILKQSIIEDEKLEPTSPSLADKLKEQKKLKKKKTIKRTALSLLGLFVIYIVWWGLKPFKSSAEYGICRTFLELSIPYPHTLNVGEIKILRDGGMRLWYSYIDAFGEYRGENFTCYLQPDPEKPGKVKLTEIKFRKINMNATQIASLNNALIYFEENPLIMNWPVPLPNNLSDLHFETDLFRRVQLNITKK